LVRLLDVPRSLGKTLLFAQIVPVGSTIAIPSFGIVDFPQPHDKNGPLSFNNDTDTFDGKAEPALDDKGNVIKGAYANGTITILRRK